MSLAEFIAALRQMSEADLRSLATMIHGCLRNPGEEVAWWEATLDVKQALGHQRRSRAAAVAARAAAQAVLAAAATRGVTLDDGVQAVARAAADAARVLSLEESIRPRVARLLCGWEGFLRPGEHPGAEGTRAPIPLAA